jgi:hypothetical protein
MPMLRTGRRRSALRGLIAVAVGLVVTVTSSAAARPDTTNGDGPVTTGTSNVYLKDTPSDDGTEPNPTPQALHESQAIKICPLGPTECAEGPDTNKLLIGNSYSVWITLHNDSNVAYTGTLRLLRTIPKAGTDWHRDWYMVGQSAPDLEVPTPGRKVRIDFHNVPGPGHFCLAAQWLSVDDPMGSEFADMYTTVKYNNNLAWRNVNSIDLKSDVRSATRPMGITNVGFTANRTNLVFTATGTPFQNAGGTVVADLGPTLFQRWNAAGGHGYNIQRGPGASQLTVGAAYARIDELPLNPGEQITLTLRFALPPPPMSTSNVLAQVAATYQLSVTQGRPSPPEECPPIIHCPTPPPNPDRPSIGGVRYYINVTS